jgi:hypothetical protein
MLILLGAGPPTTAPAAPPSPLLTGLVAYYKLDGNLAVASGNGRDLTPSSPTYGAGKIGQGLVTGAGSRTPLGGMTDDAASLAAWFKPTGIGGGIYGGTVEFDPTGTVPGLFGLALFEDDAAPPSLQAFADGSAFADEQVTAGEWSLAVVTWDGDLLHFYVNGAVGPTDTAPPPEGWSGAAFRVATTIDTPTPIDEVGVWSRALSAGEVATLYNGGEGLTYPFS